MYLEAGAAGLFANCLSSEMYELTEEERLAVTQTVVDQVAGRVPVVATGTFGGDIEKQANFVKRIYHTGINAVIVITSLLADEEESDEIFAARATQLIDLTDNIPLGFYECPVPYKRLITSEMLRGFVKSRRVIYHKDTCLDLDEVVRRIAVSKGYEFGLYDAYMVNAIDSLKAGAAGLSCIQGNIYPELIAWVCAHYNDPEYAAGVARLRKFFVDSMDIVHSAYPTIAKYCLQKRGFEISTFTRRQVEPLTDELKARADALLEEIENIHAALSISDAIRKNLVDTAK